MLSPGWHVTVYLGRCGRSTLRLPLARVDEVPSIRHSRSIILRAIRPRSSAGQRYTSALCQNKEIHGTASKYSAKQALLFWDSHSFQCNHSLNHGIPNKVQQPDFSITLGRKSSGRPEKLCN